MQQYSTSVTIVLLLGLMLINRYIAFYISITKQQTGFANYWSSLTKTNQFQMGSFPVLHEIAMQ